MQQEVSNSPDQTTQSPALSLPSIPAVQKIRFLAQAAAIRNALPSWVKEATVTSEGEAINVKLKLVRSPRLESIVDLHIKLQGLGVPVRLSIPELMPHRSATNALRSRAVDTNRLDVSKLKRYIDETLPPGSSVRKFAHYQSFLPTGRTDLIEIRGTFSDPEATDKWRLGIEKNFPVFMHVNNERIMGGGLRSQLRHRSIPGTEIVTDPREVRAIMQKIQGWPPESAPAERYLPEGSLRDLTHIKTFVTIDPKGSRDKDDSIGVEKVGPNLWRFYSAYADVSSRLSFDSEHFKYARRGGRTIYGAFECLPLLGPTLSFEHLSLLTNETRQAWVNEFTIDETGKVLTRNFFRGRIQVAHSIDYEECQQILEGKEHPLALSLRRMAWGAIALQNDRSQFHKIHRVEEDGESNALVREFAISAKENTAHFSEKNHIRILYRVHGMPSRKTRRFLQAQLERAGMDSSPSDFTHPKKFTELLSRLRTEGQRKLCDGIFDAYVGRGHYEMLNDGHQGLGLPAYMPLSGLREFAAVVNQLTMDAWFRNERGLSRGQLHQLGKEANRKQRSYVDRTHKFRVLERIHNVLEHAHSGLPGTITSFQNGLAQVLLDGFNNPISVQVPERYEIGTVLDLSNLGYDTSNHTFVPFPYRRAA